MEAFRPEKLNVMQRLIVTRGLVWFVLATVGLLCAIDAVQMVMAFIAAPWEPVGHPSEVAIRLVVAGVFYELRGNFVKHLLGAEAAAEPKQAHLSEVCEIYGGYMTVAGLFIELAESLRELLLKLTPLANPVGSGLVMLLTVMSLHIMYDLVQGARRAH